MQGWVYLHEAMIADPTTGESWARKAYELARLDGDVDLELCALSEIGAKLVDQGRIEDGVGSRRGDGGLTGARPTAPGRRQRPVGEGDAMIKGIHFLLYSSDPEADRTFLREVFSLPHVDAHDGWLIFALPPAELGVHPIEPDSRRSLFLMCEDLPAAMSDVEAKGATFVGDVTDDEGVGRFATLRLPSGATIGLYEPAHATPLSGWPTSQTPIT